MSKTRSFSIYLLKKGYDATNALDDDHGLETEVVAAALPEGASLFVLDNEPRPPWWRSYFGIRKPLNQVTKGALIFLLVKKQCFALSFGHVFHNLKDTSYEYDFGLRVTLNSVDPKKLKSTDVLEPSAARRQRTQVPVESDLTFFDFDRDSTILKSLTGKVKDAYKPLFKHATGASNLRISSDIGADQLKSLCEKLLELYESDEYKKTFPGIQNIAPVRDPSLITRLDNALLTALRAKDDSVNLTVPALIHYNDNVYAAFSGAGPSAIYDDIYIGRYYEYLDSRGIALTSIAIEDLHRNNLLLTDEDGSPRERYSIYKGLVFDTSLYGGKEVYHLSDGNWYRVETEYVKKLENYLDPMCVDADLPPYNHSSEGAYNQAVAAADHSIICLDETNISPTGQMEPCDLYLVNNGTAIFKHVKVSTFSSKLSHLFNQGTNAIELIKSEPASLEKLKALIRKKAEDGARNAMIAPLNSGKYRVIFAVVSHKDKARKSRNLPLFSRISLMRDLKSLQVMSVQGGFGFIEDQTPKTDGRKKERKKKLVDSLWET
jgi:uncharacterized protein (TIGR04141 family)